MLMSSQMLKAINHPAARHLHRGGNAALASNPVVNWPGHDKFRYFINAKNMESNNDVVKLNKINTKSTTPAAFGFVVFQVEQLYEVSTIIQNINNLPVIFIV